MRLSDISENSEVLVESNLQKEAICLPDVVSSSLNDVVSAEIDKGEDRVNESPLESPSYPAEVINETQEKSIDKRDTVDNEMNKSTDNIRLHVPVVPEASDKSDSNEEYNKSTDDFPFVQDSFSWVSFMTSSGYEGD